MRLGGKVRPVKFLREARRRRALEGWPEGELLPPHKGVYLIPNLLTTAGLFCGFFGLIAAIGGRYQVAALAILVAHVFDGLDGRLARLTRSTSRFGVEYDSLSDLVAFGVAPGVLAYKWALEPLGHWGWLAAALYVTCAALRLARFNVQIGTVEKRRFVGLPVPAAADMIAASVLLYYYLVELTAGEPLAFVWREFLILGLTYALGALMVSNIEYLSFKGMRLRNRQPFWALVVGILGLKLVIAEPQLVLFAGCSIYMFSGPAAWLWGWRGRRRLREAQAAARAAM